MPRLKTAGRLARERLAAPDVTPTERIALLKIIAGDERRKTNERIAKMQPSVKRAPKVAKTSNRDTSEGKTQRVFGPDGATRQKYALDKFLDAVRNPESPSAPVADPVPVEPVAPPVEPTAPVAKPAPVVVTIQVDKFQY